ncbi:uncharacterized protein LOC141662740 [Apium graveolens]|uniref:uncharacterized protein LOC141662740 n=1 Tax=Apium graveolens TaxID=4045 RepID=UPI003D78C882
MNYIKIVEKFFWDNIEEEELQVNDDNYKVLKQAIRLMELDDESKANQEIEDNNELKSLFGFNDYNILNIIESFSSEEQEDLQEIEVDSSEDEEIENLRMNTHQTSTPPSPKRESGETSGTKKPEGSRKRKGSSLCIASKHVIPPEHWINAERPIQAKIANGSTITISKKGKDVIRRFKELNDCKNLILDIEKKTIIEGLLDSVCSENPLYPTKTKKWMKAAIKLRDPTAVIKVRPMKYNPQDRKEFGIQIQELLDIKIIIPSKSPHMSPAFLVENEAEKRRGKKRMVVNYKETNEATIGDIHNLPNKDELLTLIRGIARRRIKVIDSIYMSPRTLSMDRAIRAPLQVKLKKDIPWEWKDSDTDYICKVKKNLKGFPKLYHLEPDDKLIIETDASDEYWGGVLKAVNSDKELICRYASESFKDAEKNYHSNEKEYLAVIRVINKFSIYLTPVKFLVRTDNRNFTYFLRIKLQGDNKQGRLVRWQQWLSRYSFDVEHIEGVKNCLADFLTREFQKEQV